MNHQKKTIKRNKNNHFKYKDAPYIGILLSDSKLSSMYILDFNNNKKLSRSYIYRPQFMVSMSSYHIILFKYVNLFLFLFNYVTRKI